MSNPVYEVAIDKIQPSPFNPRKSFDEASLQELAESIRTHGLIQPITVRPVAVDGTDGADGTYSGTLYEIVCGERRWRASRLAGAETVPALVREISEQAARELMLVENLQRNDLELLEEAEGFAEALRILDEKGQRRFTVETLAERVNKSPRHIYQMLSLLRLPQEAREALTQGVLAFSVARLVARVPGEQLREKAATEVLHPRYSEGPLTVRAAADLLQRNYMRQLKGAPFNPKDAELVPVELDAEGNRCKGGACGDCPFRTGNMEADEGESGGKNRGDVCTHLECFESKAAADWHAREAAAFAEGKRVLSEAESKRLFSSYTGKLNYDSPFVEYGSQVPDEALADPSQQKRVPSWKKLLAGLEVKPEVCVARGPDGKTHELVDRRQAEAAVRLDAKTRGVDCVLKAGGSRKGSVSDAERQERARRKRQIAIAHRMMTTLVAEIARRGLVEGFWPALVRLAWGHAGADGFWMIGKRLELKPDKNGLAGSGRDFEKAIKKAWAPVEEDGSAGATPEHAAHVVELLSAQQLKWSSGGFGFEEIRAFAGLYGVDEKACAAAVKEEMAEGKKAGRKRKAESATANEENASPAAKALARWKARKGKKTSESEGGEGE